MDKLIYLYALVPTTEASDKTLPSLPSFDKKGELQTLSIGGSTAIVCELDPEEYSEKVIENKIENDMEWLQDKAFYHHEIIATLDQHYTLIPLKFCTIYKSPESLKETIKDVEAKVMETFEFLENKQEWTLKIYGDDKKLRKHIDKKNETIAQKRQEISDMPRGRRFFEEKKIDSIIDKELDKEKERIGERLHEQLKQYAVKYSIKKNWGKDVTGLTEDMIWNSVYLISEENLEAFTKFIEQEQGSIKEDGWRVEAAGPWPAYHFSSFYQ
ncbi:GvpL/GvpF family gas vesicle protein [Staphylococcus equorum]|uniref:GvpL/GvpF family gas vesicle protein n=1 Tax=Staphylococcus equorum TaxID=246432 RepID=UPI003D804A42